MLDSATGPFEVKLTPQSLAHSDADRTLGRLSIDKQFYGELEATSQGEMLYAGNAEDSGGYVAIERVTGTLGGRRGSFVLQHNATMTHRVPQLNIIVVPNTGTDELAGLRGSMRINRDAGIHSYHFDYEIGSSDSTTR
jgi:hypothetical protein